MRELYPDAPIDDGGRIDGDLPCRSCGYILRGVAADAVCPECSHQVEQSIQGDLLVFADPRWLSQVILGLRIAAIAMTLAVVLSFIWTIVASVMAFAGSFASLWQLTVPVSAILAIATVVGAWVATTRDPGQPGPERTLSARRIARVCLAAQLLAAPIVMSTWGQAFGGFAGPLAGTPVMTIISSLSGSLLDAVVLVGEIAGLVYAGWLARRVPSHRLARHFGIVRWGLAIAAGAGLLTTAMWTTSFTLGGTTFTSGGWYGVLVVLSTATGLGTLVFTIWTLIVLWRLIRAMQRIR